ncbi:MAG: hypothetical protein JRI68_05360 [Deltaproteobacteria bacterium]|nr:hypothetical protein [Deltaproteobacteria bacterium]
MRVIALFFCSVALLSCDSGASRDGGAQGRRTEAVAASGTGAKQPQRTAERPERAPAPTILRTARPSVSASASPSPSATASAAATAPDGLLGALAKAVGVKVTRLTAEGKSQQGVIDDRGMLRPLLDAIGLQQTTTEGCQPCMPSLTFTFQDAYGTRLGTVGAFCTEAGVLPNVATLSDPLGNRCETITLLTPKVLETLAERAVADSAARPSRPSR